MNLKDRLEYHYRAFDKSHISPDPLQYLHQYSDKNDIESIGIISSVFAYGNVKQIINTMDKLSLIMEYKPFDFIKDFKKKNYHKKLRGIKHRFYTERDIISFFLFLNHIYTDFGSFKKFFLKFYNENDPNLKNPIISISKYSEEFISKVSINGNLTPGIKFMFPDPLKGSACKRINLFLRWMIRKDELDFGLWNEIPSSKLVIPVDTHIARICKELKLTSLKNVSWKMAEDITNNLKKYDSVDPVKYDFAICHIGMRKMKF